MKKSDFYKQDDRIVLIRVNFKPTKPTTIMKVTNSNALYKW